MYLIKKKKDSKTAVEDMDYDTWSNAEAAYWRKANAIHKWFVENVQNGVDDCKNYLVKKEKLEELKNICDKILQQVITEPGKVKNGARYNSETQQWEPVLENGKIIANPEICEELLPTQSGFFFGSTEYDEYYLQDIEKTSEMLGEILQETDFENEEIYYGSSW